MKRKLAEQPHGNFDDREAAEVREWVERSREKLRRVADERVARATIRVEAALLDYKANVARLGGVGKGAKNHIN